MIIWVHRSIRYGEAEREDQVGVVTGLAWTEVGGELADHRSPDDARQRQDDGDRQLARCDEGVDFGCIILCALACTFDWRQAADVRQA